MMPFKGGSPPHISRMKTGCSTEQSDPPQVPEAGPEPQTHDTEGPVLLATSSHCPFQRDHLPQVTGTVEIRVSRLPPAAPPAPSCFFPNFLNTELLALQGCQLPSAHP